LIVKKKSDKIQFAHIKHSSGNVLYTFIKRIDAHQGIIVNFMRFIPVDETGV